MSIVKEGVVKKIDSVVKEALKELENYEGDSITLKYFIKEVLSILHLRKVSYCLTWRTGMLAKSLLAQQPYCEDKGDDIVHVISEYFNRYLRRNGCVNKIDHIQNGEALITLLQIAPNDNLKYLAETYVKYLLKARTDSEGSIPFLDGDDIYVDGLMVCPFMFMYNRYISRNSRLFELGIIQIRNYMKYGVDNHTLMPYHGYNLKQNLHLGISGWGRGVGWLLSSVASSLEYIDYIEAELDDVIKKFREISLKCLVYQLNNGLFPWNIYVSNGPIDTSGTAMILYSVAKGINLHILDNELKYNVLKGYYALDQYILNGKVYQAMGDCRGFAMYPQTEYNSYPWSVSFLLLLDAEIKKWN